MARFLCRWLRGKTIAKRLKKNEISLLCTSAGDSSLPKPLEYYEKIFASAYDFINEQPE